MPFITYWKNKIKPQVSNQMVSQIDYLNSISSLIGSEIRSTDGVDLSDVFFKNEGLGRDDLVIEASRRTAYRRGDWVMIPPHKGPAIHYNVNIELGNSDEYQLYNLKDDPSQKNNLAESNTEKLQKMIESFKKIRL